MTTFYTNIDIYGNSILYRGYKDGKRVQEKIEFGPKLFVETHRPTKYKSIHGLPLEEIAFDTIREAREFTKKYKEVANFKFYGMEKWPVQFISERFWDEIKYDFGLMRICYFDIETDSEGGFGDPDTAEKMVTSIAVKLGRQMIAMGYGEYTPSDPSVKYYKCKDEATMLDAFIELVSRYDPDIISGWYSEGYDIPYIINRCKKILGEHRTKDLSPFRMLKERVVPLGFGKEMKTYDIVGIAHLDYMAVYKKFSPNKPESYKLDQIAHDEIGEKKLDYSEYGSLSKLYRENHQKFMEYNVKDTELLPKLEAKLKFFELIALISYYSKTNFTDSFKNTRIWDSLIYNHLKKKNVVIDAAFDADETHIPGGHVKEPTIGYYGWNVSVDGESLYPLAGIITGNISPDTFVERKDVDVEQIVHHGNPYKEWLIENNYSMAGNGSVFDRSKKGFLAEMMEDLFGMRKDYKNKMLDADRKANEATDPEEKKKWTDLRDFYNSYQLVLKILLNSAFGALAAPGFRYCHANFGGAITLNGQMILKWGEKTINEYLNEVLKTEGVDYVIYADTDSLFANLQPLVDKFKLVDKTTIIDFIFKFTDTKLGPRLKDAYAKLSEEMNFVTNRINFKREKISENGVWLGKKRYILNVWDKEGTRYKEPKIAVTGVESVRSSTPQIVRKALTEMFKIIMNSDNPTAIKFIDDFKKQFKAQKVEDIAFPRGANNLLKYTDRNTIYGMKCPLHVRGALLYNHHLKVEKLDDVYESVREGEKVKFVYLKIPNTIRENVIAFPSVLPEELGLHSYIDYDKMFEKSFLDPLENIFAARQWNIEDRDDFDNYF